MATAIYYIERKVQQLKREIQKHKESSIDKYLSELQQNREANYCQKL